MITAKMLEMARRAILAMLTERCGVAAPVRTTSGGDWTDTFPAEEIVQCDVQTGSGVKTEGRDREIGMLRTAFYFPPGTVVKGGYRIRRVRDDTLYLVLGPADEQSDDLALEVFANQIQEVG